MPESDSRFDVELAEWFLRRGGAWSGTASELLVSLRTSGDQGRLNSLTPVELYAHLQSHRQKLSSLGVDVFLRNGVPRMVSLRSSQDEARKMSPPVVSGLDRTSDPALGPLSTTTVSNAVRRDSVAESNSSEKFPAERPGDDDGHDHDGPHDDAHRDGFFSNTGEALFAIVEMRRQIREQGLDLEATVDLVIGRARGITKCCGVAVGFLPEEIGTRPPAASAASRSELTFDANLFQSRLTAGEAVQIADAQKHPVLGATYRRAGVGSLIMVPIFRNRQVAGAIEFFFQEKRSFSPGDVMDLGLIAGVISESLGGSKNVGFRPGSVNVPEPDLQYGPSLEAAERRLKEKEEELPAGQTPEQAMATTIDFRTSTTESSDVASTVPHTAAKKLPAAPARRWLNLKKPWAGRP